MVNAYLESALQVYFSSLGENPFAAGLRKRHQKGL